MQNLFIMNNNYCVIMAGGIGSRFWPFSRNNRPKQFLDFFGTGKSLIQLTVNRFLPLVPVQNILIVTNVAYKDMILEQLPELSEKQILLEPTRRNTAPCIAYAIARIKAENENANIIVAPSDHLILNESAFVDTIRQGLDFVETNDCLLTLGMKPTRPETGYGYIQIDEGTTSLRRVKTFTEKPNQELAEIFYKSGEFLWNSGIFLWNLKSIYHAFELHQPKILEIFEAGKDVMNTEVEHEFIEKHFPECPNISIDYGILEKADNVCVLAADFGWSDLGTWGSLYELSQKDADENAVKNGMSLCYDSKGNIIALPNGKLAVIQGLNDYIVAEDNDVLLICPKSQEQNIRQMVNDVQVKFNGKYN